MNHGGNRKPDQTANLQLDTSRAEAAALMSVSERSVNSAKKVQTQGAPDQFKLLLGRKYNRQKAGHGGDRKSKGQNVLLKNSAEVIAKEYGINEKTVKRAGALVDSIDKQGRLQEAYSRNKKAPREILFQPKCLFYLVAGAGFEPTTFGL